MKRIYRKPLTNFVKVESMSSLLAGSGTGISTATVGGGTEGSDNAETSGSGTGSGSSDFVGGLHAKKNNTWDSWDD